MAAMKVAAQSVISISDFWEMTPAELQVYAVAHAENKKLDMENLLSLEYANAAWQRSKKMPSFDKVINRKPETKKNMSDMQMLEVVKALNEAFGGKVVDK